MKGSGRPGRVVTALTCALVGLVALSGCSEAPESLRFAVIGDMGTGGPGQHRIAAAIAERARQEPLDFMLSVGDNFYPAGVLSTDDPLWSLAWEDVYDHPALDVPVYVVLGNHDHMGFPGAQLAYARQNRRWTMPGLSFAWEEHLADGTTVGFFAIDTEPIRAGLDGARDPRDRVAVQERVRRSLEWHGVTLADHLVDFIADRIHATDDVTVGRIVYLARRTGRAIDEELIETAVAAGVPEDYPDQLEWLDRVLAASDADWKVVYGHHPLFGHDPVRGNQRTMIDRVEPILRRHGVDVYMAGHDHHTDLMKPIGGVHYVTTGGGAGDDHPSPVEDTDESFFVFDGGAFTLYRVSADRFEIEVVDMDGATRHTQTIRRSPGR